MDYWKRLMAFHHIFTGFENASPLDWEADDDGAIRVRLQYDHERSSPNCPAGHWHFRIHVDPGTELTLLHENFDNIWNGRPGSPISDRTNCYLSTAKTVLPVLGVPMPSALQGIDSLLSIVQMPAGIPVGTLAIGRAGAVRDGCTRTRMAIWCGQRIGVGRGNLLRRD